MYHYCRSLTCGAAALVLLCASMSRAATGFGPWPSTPPQDCPFKPSGQFTGLEFTGRHAEYTKADTWYPSWATDGNLYSPWTDGKVNGLGSGSGGEGATTGQATIVGDDPLKLVVKDQSVFKSSPRPYEGRYPCGSLVYNGVWYYGTYCLNPAGQYMHDGPAIQLALAGTGGRLPLVERFWQDLDADALHAGQAAVRRIGPAGRAGEVRLAPTSSTSAGTWSTRPTARHIW